MAAIAMAAMAAAVLLFAGVMTGLARIDDAILRVLAGVAAGLGLALILVATVVEARGGITGGMWVAVGYAPALWAWRTGQYELADLLGLMAGAVFGPLWVGAWGAAQYFGWRFGYTNGDRYAVYPLLAAAWGILAVATVALSLEGPAATARVVTPTLPILFASVAVVGAVAAIAWWAAGTVLVRRIVERWQTAPAQHVSRAVLRAATVWAAATSGDASGAVDRVEAEAGRELPGAEREELLHLARGAVVNGLPALTARAGLDVALAAVPQVARTTLRQWCRTHLGLTIGAGAGRPRGSGRRDLDEATAAWVGAQCARIGNSWDQRDYTRHYRVRVRAGDGTVQPVIRARDLEPRDNPHPARDILRFEQRAVAEGRWTRAGLPKLPEDMRGAARPAATPAASPRPNPAAAPRPDYRARPTTAPSPEVAAMLAEEGDAALAGALARRGRSSGRLAARRNGTRERAVAGG